MAINVQWDPRLTQRGAVLRPYAGRHGDLYWKLIDARWLDETESAGKHHILIEVVEDGRRAVGVPVWLSNGGRTQHLTEAKPGELYAVAIPMFAAGNGYTIAVGDKSDVVIGLGLGTLSNPHVGAHTSYAFRFVRAVFDDDAGGVIDPVEPPQAGDWETVMALAEKLRGIAARNVGPLG